MVECNKDDAIRAKDIAIKSMKDNDFAGARKIVLGAQKLFPELEGVAQLLAICDVHCTAGATVDGKMDWYAILQVEVAVDKTIIRKQYLRLTRLLHTDKNRFPGAEAAFKLVAEANSVLCEPTKRKRYDIRTDRNIFWTRCPRCRTQYKYYICILNKSVCCQKCRTKFFAVALEVQAMPTLSSVARGSKVIANVFPNQKCDTPSQQDDHVKLSSADVLTAEKFQVSALKEDKSSVLTENDNMHGKSMPDRADPNIVDVHKSGTEDASAVPYAIDVPSPAKLRSSSGKVYVKPNVNVVENTRGELQFSTLKQDKLNALTETGHMHGRPMVGPADRNIVNTNKLGIEDAYAVPDALNVPRSSRYSSAGENADGQSGVNVAQGNEGCSSGLGRKKDDCDRSDMILGGVKTSMTNKNTGERSMSDPAALNVVGLMNLVREEVSTGPSVVRYYRRRQSGTRKQDAAGGTSLSSCSKKRQRKNDLPSAHVDMNCKEIIYDNGTNVDRLSARTLVSSKVNIQEKAETTDISNSNMDISSGQDTSRHQNADRFVFVDSSDPDCISNTIHIYPDPEFHKFEENRSCDKFEHGQVWALYDDVDAFPKLYGWISKVEPEPFTVHLIWLEACSQQEKEMFASCGTFSTFRILNQRAWFETTETFSHLVDARGTSIQRQVEILPQVGEIWAIYTPDLAPASVNACKFAIGEIIERTEAITRLSFLSKVDGYVAVFKPEKGVLEIPSGEKLKFSHRIPCFRLTKERGGKLRGLYELDPASVPDVFLPI